MMVAPLIASNRTIGTLSIYKDRTAGTFSQVDLDFLVGLGRQAAIAIENSRLFTETEQRNAELAVINSIQAGFSNNLDMQAIYDLIGDKICEIFDAESVAINAYDTERDLISTPYLWSQGKRLPNEEPIQLSEAPLRKFLVDSRKPWIINQDSVNIPDSLNAKPDERLGRWPKSGIGTPIIASDKVIGIIQIANMELENAFSNADLLLLETIANSMSVALENVRLFDVAQTAKAWRIALRLHRFMDLSAALRCIRGLARENGRSSVATSRR